MSDEERDGSQALRNAVDAELALLEDGWTIWPKDAPYEEKQAIIDACTRGGEPGWYPPSKE